MIFFGLFLFIEDLICIQEELGDYCFGIGDVLILNEYISFFVFIYCMFFEYYFYKMEFVKL